MDFDDLGTCVPGALKSSSVGVSQKLDYPEKVWSQEIFDIAIRNSDSWIFLTNELIVLTQTQMTKIWKQYCCKSKVATKLQTLLKNEIWWLQRYINILYETKKSFIGPIFYSVNTNSEEFRVMTDPRSSHFGLRNEAPNLTNDALLPLHASTKLHRSLGVTGGSISRNYVNSNSILDKTNTKIWIFLRETLRFVQKTNPNCRVMMEVDAGSTPPNTRYVVSPYCVNTNSEITIFDSILNLVL